MEISVKYVIIQFKVKGNENKETSMITREGSTNVHIVHGINKKASK